MRAGGSLGGQPEHARSQYDQPTALNLDARPLGAQVVEVSHHGALRTLVALFVWPSLGSRDEAQFVLTDPRCALGAPRVDVLVDNTHLRRAPHASADTGAKERERRRGRR